MKTLWCAIWLGLALSAGAREVEVGNEKELRNALAKLLYALQKLAVVG